MYLKGNIVYLRALEPSDSESLYKWENNPEIWQVSDTIIPYSKYSIEQYTNSIQDIYISKQLRFIICENETNRPVGAVDIFEFNGHHSRAGIGILIANSEDRNKGIASESLNLLIDYCFDVLFLNQVYCNISSENEASLNLFLSKNFQIVGLKKEWNRTKDGFSDEYLLQLLNFHTL